MLAGWGFYAIVLPGAAIGLGCGALSRGKSNVLGTLCGLLGAAMGIFTEWRTPPFAANDSLRFFLAHLHQLPNITLVLIGLGVVFAFWFGRGHEPLAWQRAEKTPDHPNSDPN